MNIQDLMVNDWVILGNKKHRCRNICGHTNDILLDNGVLINVGNLSPIPLTPEILEKNGFIKTEEERGFSEPYCVYVCDDFQYVIKIYSKGLMDRYSRLYIGECDDNENMSLLINYVHELQHALKLCGIEKNIII